MDGVGSAPTSASTCLEQPLVLRKSRETSTILTPFQVMHRRFLSVTVATTTASIFSLAAAAIKASTSFADNDSHAFLRFANRQLRAVQPLVFFRHGIPRLISSPSASSPMATLTPPAPKSLRRRIRRVTSAVAEQPLHLRAPPADCPSAPPHAGLQRLGVVFLRRARSHRRCRRAPCGRPAG